MYFVYLDEAGNTGEDLQNQDQPIHFISGVALHISQMKEIEKSLKLRNILTLFCCIMIRDKIEFLLEKSQRVFNLHFRFFRTG